LVLDEAAASIDSYTEMLIQKALQLLLQGRTGIVIVHSLAIIRNADRIVMLQHGRLIKDCDHAALMAQGGLHARLYDLNYASFDDVLDAENKADTKAGRSFAT
jgi:ATP-binding cassette subfamily B multidrug efflux pump